MDFDEILGGLTLLVILACFGFLIFVVGSVAYGFLSDVYYSEQPPTEVSSENVTTNSTMQLEQITTDDWNMNYWHGRLKERIGS